MDETVPLAVAVIVGVSLLLGGTVAGLVTYRAAAGRLPPNHLAGLRTPATLASPEAWQAGHRAGLTPATVGAAGAVLAGALVVGLARDPVSFLVTTLAGAAWVVGFTARAMVVADRTARDVAAPDDRSR